MIPEQDNQHPIKVAAIALDSKEGDVEANLLATATLLSAIDRYTDIAVLPELFSTGFIQDPDRLAQLAGEYGERTIEIARQWARQFAIALSGSCLYMDGGAVFNRGFFITPDGNTTFYDKHHLFCLSPEARHLASGHSLPPVMQYKGWNISMIICYDLRFPAWCRNRNERYDMLLVPANWPQARAYAWRHLLIARAIENQAVVVGANRSGDDEFGDYNGTSFILDPSGRIVAPTIGEGSLQTSETCGDSRESGTHTETSRQENEVIYASFTLGQLRRTRKRLPVGADADSFEITSL